MSQLLSFSFWFDQTPVNVSPGMFTLLFVLFALLAIFSSLLSIASKRALRDALDKKALRMASSSFMVSAVLGFLWLFCTYQEVQFFGMRIWFLVIVGILAGYMYKLWRFVKIASPALRQKEQSRADVNKYLPRRSR